MIPVHLVYLLEKVLHAPALIVSMIMNKMLNAKNVP